MTPSVNLCLVLHNHQPIGNLDAVSERAYQDSYLPFLDLFEPYTELAISLHTSGPLMMWLAQRHPEYLDRLRILIEAGRIEIIGGAQYEPILTMLPRRDRIGQIRCYTAWLERTLGASISGMWTPERVWESNIAGDMVAAGIGYTVLDDSYFRAAGLLDEQLTGYFLTENEGAVLRVFPGSEPLRCRIPFAPVQEAIDHCWQLAQSHPGSVVTFAEDGEKFGAWPDTQRRVYRDQWLRSFFDALTENANWLHVTTLAEAVRKTSPVGKIYLPDSSPVEPTQWPLPIDHQQAYDDMVGELREVPQWEDLRPFLRNGFWRNFRVKYAEANEMYAYMTYVSRRLHHAQSRQGDGGELAVARDHLYRGQCNTPYWHGAFGGIYQPHLRTAIYHHLIQADAAIDRSLAGEGCKTDSPFVQATVDDYDLDLQHEVRLASDHFTLWLAPSRGGQLYQWDVRSIAHNLLATMQRRPEAYHRNVPSGSSQQDRGLASIDNRGAFQQVDLGPRVGYDRVPRKSMMDHFFDQEITLDQVANGEALERGDFLQLPFQAKIRRASDRAQLQMRRDGHAWGFPITITKAVTLFADSEEIGITYLLENLPPGRTLHFAIEMNFAGLAAAADDRYFSGAGGQRLGHLGQRIDLTDADSLNLTDQTLGLVVALEMNRRGGLWAFPVETLNQCENGLERVHQSVCVMPHWSVLGDPSGRWSVQMTVRASTASNATPIAETARDLELVSR